MNGTISIGCTPVFEIDSWIKEQDIYSYTGRLTVYASKVARNPIRPFRIHLTPGEPYKPFVLYGILIKCTSSELIIKEIS